MKCKKHNIAKFPSNFYSMHNLSLLELSTRVEKLNHFMSVVSGQVKTKILIWPNL